jgi:hypothetical protein
MSGAGSMGSWKPRGIEPKVRNVSRRGPVFLASCCRSLKPTMSQLFEPEPRVCDLVEEHIWVHHGHNEGQFETHREMLRVTVTP